MKIFFLTFKIQQWKWLYAPTQSALGLALRTGITSIIALYIALWMEMSSPFWAPLTVWMVALLTPEESNAKARWHLFGTILGTIAATVLIALFPQQPAIFIILLALWVGICCFIAAFLNNFRIHGMRVAAFTFALIAIDAIPDPNQAFDIAMSRASYIILAIILQKTATSIFVGDQTNNRKLWLKSNLAAAVNKTCFILTSFFKDHPEILDKNRNIFSIFYKLNQQTEFADMAIAPHSHLGAHGRMMLAIANNIILQSFVLQKLTFFKIDNNCIKDFHQKAADFFSQLPDLIKSNINVQENLDKIKELKKNINQQLLETASKLPNQDNSVQYELLFAKLSLVYDSLINLEYMFIQFNDHNKYKKKSKLSYRINTYRNIKSAFYNGLRVFISVILAAIFWEITAWNNGMLFVMYVAIICTITSIAERPAKAAKQYWYGACFAIISTFFINFIFTPPVSNYEILTFIILPFMFIAGLASCSAQFALIGIAYNFLFSLLISFNNQERINEITYFNLCLALIGAILFTWIMNTLLFPIDNKKEYFLICKQMISNLNALPKKKLIPVQQKWIDQQISNLVYIINDTQEFPEENRNIFFYGAQAIILIGIHIIRIKLYLQKHKALPKEQIKTLDNLLDNLQNKKKFINKNAIDQDYHQLLYIYSKLDNNISLQQFLPILSSVCIIRSQLTNYCKFIKLFELSNKKYNIYI